ncbi:microcompartment protein PduM [Serratia fonticola]|uniref:Microcompartment protein PduM n=1 Tax=Serratia fonticola TaxID=47917 RepID=A0A542D4A2_SERFO|nr:microcompartment protein PduM [Serratia fonticola]TQI80129.1 microcompartment protein PduM [Serratia fonticola]TQI97844.1 microcompartment protein PduM [Serratia fonticola]TVZ72342.1 microcompartment protein PduM [Serratia fonticola]
MIGASAQTERLVSLVITRLAEREQRVYSLRLQQLRHGLDPAVYLRHASLHLQLPDLGFMQCLAAGERAEPAVSALHEAWSWGIRVHISLHQQLLAALPRHGLSALPLSLSDHQGHAVRLCTSKLLSYRDVATLAPCWLLVGHNTLVTPLARDCLSARHIQLLRQE